MTYEPLEFIGLTRRQTVAVLTWVKNELADLAQRGATDASDDTVANYIAHLDALRHLKVELEVLLEKFGNG